MRLVSRNSFRGAAALALAIGSGLAQAHEGHGAHPMHTHVNVDRLIESTSAMIEAAAPFVGAVAVLTALVLAAVLISRGVRQGRWS